MLNPRYSWKVKLRKTYVTKRADLASLQSYITELKISEHILDITLEIPSKTEKEVEDIKSRMIDLDWEVILCANKGLSTKPWWEDLLDKLSTYDKGDKKSYED
jgi:hypothetical protein